MFDDVYKGKRVLVTGHTGFKGSWLTQWLLNLNGEVKGYSLNVPTKPSLFEVLGLAEKIEHMVGDVRNLDFLVRSLKEFQPEIVFHLAAQSLVRKSYDEPHLTFETNLLGTVNVLEALRSTPSVRAAVVITSDKCYDNVEWEYGYRETDSLGGKDPYSASKAGAEIAFRAYYESFFSGDNSIGIATTRAGNVIGGGDWSSDRIVSDAVKAWSNGKQLEVRNPNATRPWQHVLEPLSGYLWLGAKLFEDSSRLSGEPFNFGPTYDVVKTVRELLNEMESLWGDAEWREKRDSNSSKKESGLLKLNWDKALHKLQWEPTLTFDEAVRFTVNWYMNFYYNETAMDDLTIGQISEYCRLAKDRGRNWANPL